MIRYPWPGNLRELRHQIERACILAEQTVLPASAFEADDAPAVGDSSLKDQLHQHERQVIERALALCGYQMAETAAHLGISRKNLWERMKRLDLKS